MIKDIPQRKVEDFAIAIVPPENGDLTDLWEVYVLNLQEATLRSVLVTSKGYGELDGEQRKTATMRYFIEELGPMEMVKIEPIQPAVFALTNEYWVSFSFDNHLFDKKYVFVQGSIHTDHFTIIPFLNRKGVMIR